MTTKKETQNNNFNATIGNTVLSAVALILFSCKEPIKVKPDRNLDFIVTEKVSLKNENGGFVPTLLFASYRQKLKYFEQINPFLGS